MKAAHSYSGKSQISAPPAQARLLPQFVTGAGTIASVLSIRLGTTQ